MLVDYLLQRWGTSVSGFGIERWIAMCASKTWWHAERSVYLRTSSVRSFRCISCQCQPPGWWVKRFFPASAQVAWFCSLSDLFMSILDKWLCYECYWIMVPLQIVVLAPDFLLRKAGLSLNQPSPCPISIFLVFSTNPNPTNLLRPCPQKTQ